MYKIYYSRKMFALINDHPTYYACNLTINFDATLPKSKCLYAQGLDSLSKFTYKRAQN